MLPFNNICTIDQNKTRLVYNFVSLFSCVSCAYKYNYEIVMLPFLGTIFVEIAFFVYCAHSKTFW